MENVGRELSERKKQILKAIIDAHIEGGEPVGSKSLMQNKQISCSSATIRNEMAELEEMGYLEQPHTSAGRVPSVLGYRFYVDSLLEHYAMTSGEINEINNILRVKMNELDQVLVAASKLASKLTNYTGIAIKPRTSSVSILKVETIYIDPQNFILVIVASTGAVKTKYVKLDTAVSEETVAHFGYCLNTELTGLSMENITLPIIMRIENAMGGDAALVNPIIKTIYEVMSELDGGELNLSGLSHLTQYPEYSDVGRLGELMSAFESKEEILNLVSGHTEDKVNVYLGSESSVRVMDQSALIFKPIKRGGKTVGAIGVIGPLRMDYAKVLATIESLCGNIADLIGDDGAPMPPNSGLLNDKNHN